MKSAFAEALGDLRREKNLSQRRAAEQLGVSQALLSHYENDAREPKLDFVIRACDYYGVTADYILGRSVKQKGVSERFLNDLRDVVAELIDLKMSEDNLISKLEQLSNG